MGWSFSSKDEIIYFWFYDIVDIDVEIASCRLISESEKWDTALCRKLVAKIDEKNCRKFPDKMQ